jgi:hypothetical protein
MKHEHIKQIFARTDIHQIREFLVAGLDLEEIDKRPYDARLEDGSLHITNRLKNHSKDEQEFSDIYDEFCEATIVYTDVFLEIGMRVGARLLFQLLCQDI